MILKLVDYKGGFSEHEIGNLEDIAKISIRVVTGDEIADVVYKDYAQRSFDSRDDRLADYYDYGYEIYDFRATNNVMDSETFKNRTKSYW